MSKPDQPPVKVTAIATRVYRFDPDERRIVKDWKGDDLVAVMVTIERNETGHVSATCNAALRFKKDGTVGRGRGSTRPWFSPQNIPAWVRELMDDMPTPKVTLTPPRKASA